MLGVIAMLCCLYFGLDDAILLCNCLEVSETVGGVTVMLVTLKRYKLLICW